MSTIRIRNHAPEEQDLADLKEIILKLVQATGENGMPVKDMIEGVQAELKESGEKSERRIRSCMQEMLEYYELDTDFKWHLIDPDVMQKILDAPYDEVKDKYNYVAWS